MKILFIHQNFPGQFKFLAPALVKAGHEVSAFTLQGPQKVSLKVVRLFPYSLNRVNAKDGHSWARDFESKVIRGEACMRAAMKLREEGYMPDVIVAHPGWGESLFIKQVWPDVRLKLYCEFFYHPLGADVGFDPEFSSQDPADAGRVTLKNANMLLHFQQADAGISPTYWQASTFPSHIRDKITVVHDGIDTEVVKPKASAEFVLDSGEVLTRNHEVVTFVNRSLEPYRGFHVFMRSLPTLLSQRPNAQVLLVGGEGVSYGAKPAGDKSWKQIFCSEVLPQLKACEQARIHFLGNVSYDRYLVMLQVSRVHVYLSYPFVLSWSLLEAMSVGCAIIASDTQPLHEAITHNETGLLVDFFDHETLAHTTTRLLLDAEKRQALGQAARALAIANYDLETVCLPKQITWVCEDLAPKRA